MLFRSETAERYSDQSVLGLPSELYKSDKPPVPKTLVLPSDRSLMWIRQ